MINANPLLIEPIEKIDPNIPQRAATIPEHDVWVAASAGSGKTKVLTDRVLRLLLPDPEGRWAGTAPHRILCITFTKAAAALMAIRVQKILGEWAVMEGGKLRTELKNLLGQEPNDKMITAARTLFAKVLDSPSGLSIMTIHSFCQSILGRFALEAGVTPGFQVMEEAKAHELLRHIVDDCVAGVTEGDMPLEFQKSFCRIATYMDYDSFRDTLLTMIGHSRELMQFIDGCPTSEAMRDVLSATLDLGANTTRDDVFADFLDDIKQIDMLNICRLLATGAKTYAGFGDAIATWLALKTPEKQKEQISTLENALLTKKKEIRSIGTKLEEAHPEMHQDFISCAEKYLNYLDRLAVINQVEQTSDVLQIVSFCLAQFAKIKKDRNVLDFNDLILKTRALLESGNLLWVHFKLDEGIDHILVDEAQDTNRHQWEIIRLLSQEFQAGLGDTNRQRSLFVVGDEKQSIFSFHGADPTAFHKMRDYFKKRSENAGRIFSSIHLETSFRSAEPILELVDNVFERHDLRQSLGLPTTHTLTHYAFHGKMAGLVELWDADSTEKTKKNENYEWVLPATQLNEIEQNESTSSFSLAKKIADTISGWLTTKEKLESEGRPIEPRDILILVRTRTGFVADVVRQLKMKGVPVSGVDRMKLTNQIAVMDCMALARFALFPDDDLSLACLLRSPFIRISEDELMGYALGRGHQSLYEALRQKAPAHTINWLQNIIIKAQSQKPFDFFDTILNESCPYQHSQNLSGWKAFTTCLGADSVDPLDEFLSYCLLQEDNAVFSLEEFLVQLQSSDIEIKRDNEGGGENSINQVRIMTVHASKGLEAPIVFLPDTESVPSKGKIDRLQWIKQDGNMPDIPLWAVSKKEASTIYQNLAEKAYEAAMDEHMRLLYVALTRPRERLYVAREGKSEKINDASWYAIIKQGFEKLPFENKEGVMRYHKSSAEESKKKEQAQSTNSNAETFPDFLKLASTQTIDITTRQITPSRLEAMDKSPLNTRFMMERTEQKKAILRGNVTHKLFEILPDIQPDKRRDMARHFIDKFGDRLDKSIRDDILTETMAIIEDSIFADIFGANSMAEVPVSGDMGDGTIINGQIDRLVIRDDVILIVDFKTNRPSPTAENDVPESYKKQLKAYKTAMSRLYPARTIKCALLWTDKPFLMPIEV